MTRGRLRMQVVHETDTEQDLVVGKFHKGLTTPTSDTYLYDHPAGDKEVGGKSPSMLHVFVAVDCGLDIYVCCVLLVVCCQCLIVGSLLLLFVVGCVLFCFVCLVFVVVCVCVMC